MEEEAASRLSSVPWVAALLKDPKWTLTITDSRHPKPSTEDSFMAETLATGNTIQDLFTLIPAKELGGDLPYKEVLNIARLGEGLNGYPKILHGGMVATLLDEACGILIISNMDKKVERLKRSKPSAPVLNTNYMTAYLNTSYKRPITTPTTIMCSAKVTKEDGRKIWIRSTIEDGAGTVFSVGEAMFIRIEAKL